MDKEVYVHLFHIIIVGSLFLYVGISRDKTTPILYPILLGLGIIIILYHIYKTYKYIQDNKGYWVNLIHIFWLLRKKMKKFACKVNFIKVGQSFG